jgi:hypothetical protein
MSRRRFKLINAGSGGGQTPWASDIDGAGFGLDNIDRLEIQAPGIPGDTATFTHDGTDFNTAFTNTVNWTLTGLTGNLQLDNDEIEFTTNNSAQRISGRTGSYIELYNGSTGDIVLNSANNNGVTVNGPLSMGGYGINNIGGSLAIGSNTVSGNNGAYYQPYNGGDGDTYIRGSTLANTLLGDIKFQTGATPTVQLEIRKADGNVYVTNDLDAGNLTATTFNGVALTTGGLATNFLNETGTYTAAGGGGTTVDAGTADGEMLIWDQTTDTAWEPTDFLVANPAAGTLSFKKTGDFTSLVITTADTDGISNVTTFSNGNAEDFMSFRDANSFGLIEVHANDMRFEANDISSNGSNRITFISTGGGRAEIYLTNANALRLDNSTGAFTHVESVEPIGVLTTTKPVSSIEGFLFWQETANTAGCGYVMNDQAKSHPIGNMQHLNYRWNSPNTAADPGPGFFRLDAAGGWTSTTELYFADEDYGDQDSGLWFSFLAVGDCLRIMDSTDHSRWAAMEVTSITDNTGWWTVGVNMLDFGGFEPINGRVCDISCEKWSVLGAVPTSISSTQTYLSGSSWVAASGATATNESGATTLFESGAILEFEEQASLTAPAATFGRLWVRDDTPNTLVYTDDAGTVHSCIEPDTQSIVTATSTELLDIADAINTGADKVAGYQVFNTTTTAPVWAVGDTDGAVWVDATGTTAHTPV